MWGDASDGSAGGGGGGAASDGLATDAELDGLSAGDVAPTGMRMTCDGDTRPLARLTGTVAG